MQTQTEETLGAMTPEIALMLLKEGNRRFFEKRNREVNYLDQIAQTSTGQFPFAVVLGCIDSRVPPELIFDLGIGDIFSVRIAGNIVNEDILGSMEFACRITGSKHILVLGHTSCGAIQGACDGVELGNLTGLLEKLKPAVEAIRESSEVETELDLNRIAEINVQMTVQQIQDQSPVLKEMLENGEVGISGGMYDVSTGKVSFL